MIEFFLPIKPFSVNAYRYRDQRFKTKEARDWEVEVKVLLEEFEKDFSELKEDFDNANGELHVSLCAVYPPHTFYNKSGGISAKTIDITNFEKPLIDLIFKETIGIDDRFITHLISTKQPGASLGILVKIALLPKYR